MISAAIDDCIALSHGAIDRVEIVTLVSAPALDHVALCIVTDPLAGTIGAVSPLASFGFLIDILAGGFLALINRVQPVPSIGSRVIDFLAAAFQALANALFVPVIGAIDGYPLFIKANAGVLIERARYAVNFGNALGHGAKGRVKVVGALIGRLPALDHVAVLIVTDPLAGAIGLISPLAGGGFLVNVLVDGHCAALDSIQPVPGIGIGIIDLFAAALSTLLHAVFVPVLLAVFFNPAVLLAVLGGVVLAVEVDSSGGNAAGLLYRCIHELSACAVLIGAGKDSHCGNGGLFSSAMSGAFLNRCFLIGESFGGSFLGKGCLEYYVTSPHRVIVYIAIVNDFLNIKHIGSTTRCPSAGRRQFPTISRLKDNINDCAARCTSQALFSVDFLLNSNGTVAFLNFGAYLILNSRELHGNLHIISRHCELISIAFDSICNSTSLTILNNQTTA